MPFVSVVHTKFLSDSSGLWTRFTSSAQVFEMGQSVTCWVCFEVTVPTLIRLLQLESTFFDQVSTVADMSGILKRPRPKPWCETTADVSFKAYGLDRKLLAGLICLE
ncbi:hypothetical protein ILYODFUR_025491 [Ilyodon furcidens]|uniref:Uncharacterized protein n=1 Tax=Ilyodon furcidens TaxID=33524 RepID=A0ABV0UKJ7_9TELE